MNVRTLIRNTASAVVLAAIVAGPWPVRAQDAPPETVTRVFELSYVEPSQLASTLGLFDANIQSNDTLGTLTVRARTDVMPAIEDVVRRLDLLQVERAVEVTAHVLRARNDGNTSNVPDHLDPVVEQLRNVFAYSSYDVIDTLVIRGVDGRRPSISGTMALDSGADMAEMPVFYTFQGHFRVVSSGEGVDALRIDELNFELRIPVVSGTSGAGDDVAVRSFQYVNVGINTDVEIPAGTEVVVGKATVGDSAVILVMTVEFLN